ncbi:Uncharacterised protein [Mycobacteroides abscessus subsp. abscessus]|nr:Uncharacterised protein [Mycobacteroides abscessus subsp. abscessus]
MRVNHADEILWLNFKALYKLRPGQIRQFMKLIRKKGCVRDFGGFGEAAGLADSYC